MTARRPRHRHLQPNADRAPRQRRPSRLAPARRRPFAEARTRAIGWPLGFGSGLSPVAPGTAGTLWAWLAWWALGLWLTPAQLGWLLVAALPLAWAGTVTARHLRTADRARS